MRGNVIDDLLRKLDNEHRRVGEQSIQSDVVREHAPDGSECLIVYSSCRAEGIDEVIAREISLAKCCKYTLEWKVYDHDSPLNLKDRLIAFGFERGPVESLMVLPVNEAELAAFNAPA
jgi:hypothetical protein